MCVNEHRMKQRRSAKRSLHSTLFIGGQIATTLSSATRMLSVFLIMSNIGILEFQQRKLF